MIRGWAASLASRLGGVLGGGGVAAHKPPTNPTTTPLSPAARVDTALADFAAVEAASRARASAGAAAAAAAATAHPPPTPTPETPSPLRSPANPLHDPTLLASLAQPNATLQGLPGPTLGELAFALYAGKRVPKDTHRATRLWVYAASKNHLPSVLAVALASCDGLGVIPKDWTTAEGLLSKLCTPQAGELKWAKYALATLLLKRLGGEGEGGSGSGSGRGSGSGAVLLTAIPTHLKVSPSAIRALGLLREVVAVGGVPPAAFNLANCLLAGVGTPTGEGVVEEGWGMMERAAGSGDPLAAAAWASHLDSGGGGVSSSSGKGSGSGSGGSASLLPSPPSPTSPSTPFWRLAAEAGHSVAMHNVGVAYMGATPSDVAAAKVWFRRAGEGGYYFSRVNLGVVLLREGDFDGADRELGLAEEALVRVGGEGGEGLRATRNLREQVKRGRARGLGDKQQGGQEQEEGEAGDLVLFFPSKEERDRAYEDIKGGDGVTQASILEVVDKYKGNKVGMI